MPFEHFCGADARGVGAALLRQRAGGEGGERRGPPAGRQHSQRRQGDRHAGGVGHGQRHCGRAHGVEVQVQDPADGLLGVVVLLAQLGVVGLSEGLEDAAQPAHDGGPHVLVGLLVGDEADCVWKESR